MWPLYILVVLFSLKESIQVARFDNYKVYRVSPKSDEHVKILSDLESLGKYDFWSFGGKGKPVDVMVPPHLDDEFNNLVQSLGMQLSVFIGNVQERINQEKPIMRSSTTFGWDDYYRLDEIYSWLKSLPEQYLNIVSIIKGGDTFEGRDILGVYVTFSPNNYNKAVFIEGGIHAREWISPATTTWILNEILTSSDPEVRLMAESHDWFIFPVTNPDGYEYTHTNMRLWRKTRRPYSYLCYGADPNRNWGFEWNTGGASSLPCSDTYAGFSAFSEVETATLSEFINTIAPRLKAYFGIHSYMQLLLLPYGIIRPKPDNYNQLLEIGNEAAEALRGRYGTTYTVGNIVDVLYVASGSSLDWIKGVHNVNLTYVFELRDRGQYGFLLPADQIVPTAEETLEAFKVILRN